MGCKRRSSWQHCNAIFGVGREKRVRGGHRARNGAARVGVFLRQRWDSREGGGTAGHTKGQECGDILSKGWREAGCAGDDGKPNRGGC